jgi:hypothetical protein
LKRISVGADVVFVGTSEGRKASMGFGMHLENILNGNVDREIPLKGFLKIDRQRFRGIEMRKKLSSVYPGIGSPLPHALDWGFQQFAESGIQNFLNGDRVRLNLPTVVIFSKIFQLNEKTLHKAKVKPNEPCIFANQKK